MTEPGSRYGLGAGFQAEDFYPTIGTVVSDYLASTRTTWTDWTEGRALSSR